MSLCIIELNDSEIRVAKGTEIVLRSPGYAVIKNEKLYLGEQALKLAHLNPRQTYNQFWNKLSQDALQNPAKQYRHHADLAFAHLLSLYEQAGKPEEILFAVPGNYTTEQLSLLLGIAEASPFTAIGLVDSAIASTAAIIDSGNYQHIDIHLHQTVITQLQVKDEISRQSVEIIDETGLSHIYTACASLIADLFIQQSRFDPLHHAETEQALYDQLPRCLQSLHENKEVLLEIQFKQNLHQAKLHRHVLSHALQTIYQRIAKRISPSLSCLLSDRMAALPYLADVLPEYITLNVDAVFLGCREYTQQIRTAGPSLSFITTLPASKNPTVSYTTKIPGQREAPTRPAKTTVTHVLYENQAYPIGNTPLYLSGAGAPGISKDQTTAGCVMLNNHQPVLTPAGQLQAFINGRLLNSKTPVQAGDTMNFRDSSVTYKFISVLDDNGP